MDSQAWRGFVQGQEGVATVDKGHVAQELFLHQPVFGAAAFDNGAELLPGIDKEQAQGVFVFQRGLAGQDCQELIAAGNEQVEELFLLLLVGHIGAETLDDKDQKGVKRFEDMLQFFHFLKAERGLPGEWGHGLDLTVGHGQEQGDDQAVIIGAQGAYGKRCQGLLKRGRICRRGAGPEEGGNVLLRHGQIKGVFFQAGMEKTLGQLPGKSRYHRLCPFFVVDGGVDDAIAQLPLRIHIKIEFHENGAAPLHI